MDKLSDYDIEMYMYMKKIIYKIVIFMLTCMLLRM
jgi:hypothetical protein